MCDPSVKGRKRPTTTRTFGGADVQVPVPYVVARCDDLKPLHAGRCQECMNEHLCQICGTSFADEPGYGIPLNGVFGDGFNGDSLMHEGCLRDALALCPGFFRWVSSGSLDLRQTDTPARYRVADGKIDTASVTWERVTIPDSEHPKRPPVRYQLLDCSLLSVEDDRFDW